MARFIGLDIGARYVRAALLATGYRRLTVERLEEVPLSDPENLSAAITTAASHLLAHTEGVCVAMDGELTFVHRITLPPTALKQLAEVLPFEIESQVPVDVDELVFDYRTLARPNNQAPVTVLMAAARTDQVRARIELVEKALGREPERVTCGPMVLANLAAVSPALRSAEPIAILDLGGKRTEVTILQRGQPVFARTLSRGVEGLPATAPQLVAELRQTFLAWAAQDGGEISAVYLAGGGAFADGADRFLAHELGMPIQALPAIEVEGATPELVAALPRFAKAVALALGAAGRGHDVDLRRGPLSYQRGYGFLKDKAPVLVGLCTATLVSFLFATWAEVRALARENTVLTEQLAVVGKDVFGTEVDSAETALDLLEKARSGEEADPMPQMDAFDVVIAISKTIPGTITHDIEEFDMQRGHAKIQGILGTASEAQSVATDIAKVRCLQDAKLGKVTQAINSDRQKYVLDIDVKCPDEKKKPKKKTDETGDKAPGSQP